MSNLCNFYKKDYATLLASEVLDASKGVLFATADIRPDVTNRTILIGVGGIGVRTIDYVKGAISKRLDKSWSRYVAFLGIDTSWWEFEKTAYLLASERIVATKPGICERLNKPESYPNAIRRVALDGEQMRQFSFRYSSDGYVLGRLTGKVKIHDKAPDSLGVDEEIVAKLDQMRHSTLEMLHGPDDMYQIYVIGSVCGGTCGGAMTEMPALIRKVFNEPHKVRVNTMLYLPDTMAHMVPANRDNLYACGYASLKELNYYMGMYMRPDYSETWSYNDPASPELIHKTRNLGKEGFYNVACLIGTPNGPTADAMKKAQQTVGEFLIDALTENNGQWPGDSLQRGLFSNGMAPFHVADKKLLPGIMQKCEAYGEAHEFPKRFSAIGFAEASLPQKLVRAYNVGKVCSMAGLKPVSAEERISLLLGNPNALLPFRAKDDLLTASEGTAKAIKLMEPLKDIVRIVNSGEFDFCIDLTMAGITWTKIKNNEYDNPMFAAKTEAVIKAKTSIEMMDALNERVVEAYRTFYTNVREYVREEGPYAFVNLYKGIFIPVDHNFGMGLGQMLQNLVNGKTIDGKPVRFIHVEDAKSNLDAVRCAIAEQAPGIFGIEGGVHRDQCSKWVAAYNKWGSARINKVRRETALGQHGAICKSFMMPAAKLAEDLEAFGTILETLAETYQWHGQKMNHYQQFSEAQDNKTQVNLAAMSTASYQWVKCKAEQTLNTVNVQKVRDSLVDHFFDNDTGGYPNSKKWLEFPDRLIDPSIRSSVKLAVDEQPVPARQIFDEIVAREFPYTVQLSIVDMFNQLQQGGLSIQIIANNIIDELYAQSKPLFNGNIPYACCSNFIVYPSVLRETAQGQMIAQALENAAYTQCNSIRVYSSDDADSIKFYRVATPMEIYRLYDLREWERGYEYALTRGALYLHGKSPAEAEGSAFGIPWEDYPPITVPARDPRVEDPYTGEVSREGKLLQKLDMLIERARELGVLYSEQTDAGWIIKRVYCDNYNFWRFELNNCRPDPNFGLIPLGKNLAEAVAFQNNKDLAEMSRKVRLNMGGIMDMPHATEALAWEYAARTLRAHVPMYIEVCETVKKFEAWAEAVEDHNRGIMELLKPGMMVWMIKGRVLRRMDDGMWVYIMPDGTQTTVEDLNDLKVRFKPREDRFMVNNGLVTYYLFTKLNAVLPDQKAFEEGYRRGQKAIQDLEATGQTDELAAGEELAAVLLEEIDALEEKGACMDGNPKAKPLPSFVQAMSGIAREKLTDISMFYAGMAMWKKL